MCVYLLSPKKGCVKVYIPAVYIYIYPKMVNFDAMVNRHILGYLHTYPYVSVPNDAKRCQTMPNVVIEIREAKAHVILSTVKKKAGARNL